MRGEVDAGLLIHEGQLTYADAGLHLWADMGEWWLQDTGLPLPLGGNAVRRDLGREVIEQIGARPPCEHRVCARAPGSGPGPCQPLQPGNRSGADRYLRRDVRESMDGGLRPARSRRRAGTPRPRPSLRPHPRTGGGRLRRVIDRPRFRVLPSRREPYFGRPRVEEPACPSRMVPSLCLWWTTKSPSATQSGNT